MFTIYFFVFLLVKFEDHNALRSHHTCTNEASSAPLPHKKKHFLYTPPNQRTWAIFWKHPTPRTKQEGNL